MDKKTEEIIKVELVKGKNADLHAIFNLVLASLMGNTLGWIVRPPLEGWLNS